MTRKHLQHLENVRVSSEVGCLIGLGCIPVVLIVVWVSIAGFSVMVIPAVALTAAIFYLLGVASIGHVQTNSNGIAYRKGLQRKYIAWQDVTLAETVRNADGLYNIVVESEREKLDVFMESPEDAYLKASVWQHLRAYGKESGIRLDKTADSLWWDISDSFPSEMEWNYKVGRKGSPPSRFTLTPHHISKLVTGEKYANDKPVKRRPNPVVIRWCEVTNVWWYSWTETDYTALVITGAGKKKIELPLSRRSKVSGEFMLGVIRHLRTIDRMGPIAIPSRLIKQSGSAREDDKGGEQ